jgi:hypothetical protein
MNDAMHAPDALRLLQRRVSIFGKKMGFGA